MTHDIDQGETYRPDDGLPTYASPASIATAPLATRTVPANVTTKTEPWLALSAVVLLGGISGVIYYLGFVRPYLLSEYFATPLLDLAKINGHTPEAANLWGLTWLVLFACYYFAFRICPPSLNLTHVFRIAALVVIVGWSAFFAINLIFMYPVGAADLFDQIFRARLTAHYGYNPFTTLPQSVQGDPFQPYVAWSGDPSPYGPMWESLAAGASLVGGGSLWNNLIAFKVLVLLAYAVSVALTYGILRRFRPEWALRGTLFFAWNPLVLFEIPGNGHNDAFVVMFVLAAVYLLVAARRAAVFPMLAAGVLTKFVPLLLVPVAAAAIWRDRLRPARLFGVRRSKDDPPSEPLSTVETITSLAVGALLAVGLAAVLYAPFWTGFDSIMPRNRERLFTASIPKVVLDTLTTDFGWSERGAQSFVSNAAYAIVGLVVVALALWVLLMRRDGTTPEGRHRLLDRTLLAFYEIIFAYLAIASLWFQPWYVLWLVALTAPVARYAYANRTILFCIGAVANYFVWDFVWLWNRSDFRTVQQTSALCIYSLPLLYAIYTWLRPGRRATGDGRS